ncbi:hypothetical protein [Alienimonas californiensis]|uniref:Uncharacterized protein n=1 Tax=Alienimonas californiensis TaxID=2527989 RepID=A0A517PBJ3_9PLAN|nr:hypothetical protein [Alienimonas californiensis]QDT16729.1 hypothetical protein CA12_28350 [Alienimonas californiensis]
MRRPPLPPIAALLVASVATLGPSDARGQAPFEQRVPTAGVGGFVRPGAWVPLRVESLDLAEFRGGPSYMPVAVEVTDGDGLRLQRQVEAVDGVCLIQAGRAESEITFSAGDVGLGQVEPETTGTLRPGDDFTVLAPDERLWAAVRLPAALSQSPEDTAGPLDRPGRPVRIAAFPQANDLPSVPGALGTVRTLLIDADDWPDDDAFLQKYVAGGGHLIVSLSATGELPDWIPLTPGGPVALTARPALERLAKAGSGRGTAAVINRLVPAAVRPLDATEIAAADGRVLATGDGGALVAELPIGFGRATVVAASLHEAPLSGWGGLPSFLLELTRSAPGGAGPGDRAPTGEMADQVYEALEADVAAGASPGTVGVWALVLLVVVGPLDYLLVHRLLNRPALTWVTLPLWLGGATALAVWGTAEADATPRRLELVDVDVAANRVRGAAWATVPAPEAGRLTVRVTPTERFSGEPDESRLGYAAEPGATFGGLYRGGGMGLTPGEYAVAGTEAVGVPLPERSAKRFRLDWTGPGDGAVAGQLATENGLLTGTVSHTLPGALSDFFLIHNGRVYRPDPERAGDPYSGAEELWEDGSMPSGAEWRPDGPGVLRRDLRGFLTQVREVREGPSTLRGGGDDPLKFDETQRLVYTRYAARSRDFGVILPALSLYAQSGGAAFTGLSNAELEGLDLSALAGSGRALLFGRLDAPLTDLEVTFGDPFPADGPTVTYVRAVLPVTERSADAAPAGPSVGPVRLDSDAEAPALPRRRPLGPAAD